MNTIAAKIKHLRQEKKLSADKLAEMLGRKGQNRKQFIYDLESGRVKKPDIQTLTLLSKAFGISLAELALNHEPELNIEERCAKCKKDATYWKDKYLSSVENENALQARIIQLLEKK